MINLKKFRENFNPDLVIYDAGVDVHENDKLGNLKLTSNGILARDKKVISYFKNKSIPVATVIGGGYSDNNLELAQRHSIIFQAVDEIYNYLHFSISIFINNLFLTKFVQNELNEL